MAVSHNRQDPEDNQDCITPVEERERDNQNNRCVASPEMARIGPELSENFWSGCYVSVSVLEIMVAGQDINFGMIHALGKEKEGRQKGQKDKEAGEEQNQDQEERTLSAGASR